MAVGAGPCALTISCTTRSHSSTLSGALAAKIGALDDASILKALSLGGPRRFRLRPRDGSGDVIEVEMTPGSVVTMAGATQDHYEHELPLRDDDPPRISLTFRSIVPGFEDALATANDLCVEEAKPR